MTIMVCTWACMATVEKAYVQSLAAGAAARLGRALIHNFKDFHLKKWQLELLPLNHQTSCVLWFGANCDDEQQWRGSSVARAWSVQFQTSNPKRLLRRWARRPTLVKKMKGRKWSLSLSLSLCCLSLESSMFMSHALIYFLFSVKHYSRYSLSTFVSQISCRHEFQSSSIFVACCW